jgi:3-deoxy-D-manno-octulosonic-acid transferase
MGGTWSRRLYSWVLWLLLPYIAWHLWARSRKQPEYLRHVGERFGRYQLQVRRPVIWLHTVSVGETRAAASLVERLLQAYPDHQLLLTHTTPTGRAESERLYGEKVWRVYLPYDYPFAVRRFLQSFRPALGVLLETEIWPNLIAACQEQQAPLLLLNARMSEKSARRYGRYPALTKQALQGLATIAAQTEADAERLRRLGAQQVAVMGNLKFDIEPPAEMLQLGQAFRQRFGVPRKVFLAASTRDGEEALLLDVLGKLEIPGGLLTVIVPRHPQRFADVAAMLEGRGLAYVRRSGEGQVPTDVSFVLGDSMGEMYAYYAACDVAFIGGSLLPFGGQNLIEACAVGRPVLVGSHTYNFAEAAQAAVEAGAAMRVQDAAELGAWLELLFGHPEQIADMGKAGKDFVARNCGAVSRAMSYIESVRSKSG